MNHLNWDSVQAGLFHPKPWVRGLTVLGITLVVGAPVGAIIGLLGGIYGSAVLIALVVAYLMLRSIFVGLIVLISIVCLLPFAALPIDIGFSPTFLDMVFVALFFVWAGRLVTRKEQEFIASAPSLGVLLLVSLAVVSFILGLSHARLTSNVLRHFGEILLSILLFLLVINTVRVLKHLKILVIALILAGFVAAFIGIVLYFFPEDLTVRL